MPLLITGVASLVVVLEEVEVADEGDLLLLGEAVLLLLPLLGLRLTTLEGVLLAFFRSVS